MRNIIITIGLLLITIVSMAQVGIGTNNPQATIHTDGIVRITNIKVINDDDNSLTGVTGSNVLNRTDLGANLFIQNNKLENSPVSRSMGTFDLGVVPIDASGNIDGLDLDLGIGEDNELTTFIRIYGYNSVIKIAGIQGGTEGRHLTLYMSEVSNVRFLEEGASANPQDRFMTLTTSQLQASGQAIIEFVYDADAGPDGLGRWLVIKFRG